MLISRTDQMCWEEPVARCTAVTVPHWLMTAINLAAMAAIALVTLWHP
jgi:hypothetical protein